METELFVIQDNNTKKFLMETRRGEPVFVPLPLARTFCNMTAVQNQVTRMKGSFDVAFRRARLIVADL
jgi:hypothetical protein